jgi:hypothetical protein
LFVEETGSAVSKAFGGGGTKTDLDAAGGAGSGGGSGAGSGGGSGGNGWVFLYHPADKRALATEVERVVEEEGAQEEGTAGGGGMRRRATEESEEEEDSESSDDDYDSEEERVFMTHPKHRHGDVKNTHSHHADHTKNTYVIVDCRSALASKGNQAMGRGTESSQVESRSNPGIHIISV